MAERCAAYESDLRITTPTDAHMQDDDGAELSRVAALSQQLGAERITLLGRIATQPSRSYGICC